MTTDLDRLIEAVEAGTLAEDECLSNGNKLPMCATTWDAYNGSVDAALAMCAVLLPGWVATIGTVGYAIVCENETKITRHASALLSRQPARALLLAVLRAKLMEMENDSD